MKVAVGPLVLYNAAAIARPIRAVLDSFAARRGARYEQETASNSRFRASRSSVETAPNVARERIEALAVHPLHEPAPARDDDGRRGRLVTVRRRKHRSRNVIGG